MKRFVLRMTLMTSTLGLTYQALAAGEDSCDDYVARHNRRNIRPTRLSMRELGGQQEVHLTIESSGDQAADIGILDITLGGLGISHAPTGPLGVGAKREYVFKVSAGRFKHCQNVRVAIDTSRSSGQWGCAVYTDDVANLKMEVDGRLSCALIRSPYPRPWRPWRPWRPRQPE